MFFFLRKVLTLFFFLSFAVCWADTKTLQPVGEYAEIDVHKDTSAFEILKGPESEEKKSLAEKIHQSPGDYGPFLLLYLGIYYLEKDNLSQALHYMRAGIFRATVDVDAAKDNSLVDILPIMNQLMSTAVGAFFQKNPDKEKEGLSALMEVSRHLMDWDFKTPRNYDARWPCLHSSKGIKASVLNDVGAKTGYATKEEYNEILKKHRSLFLAATEKGISSIQSHSEKRR